MVSLYKKQNSKKGRNRMKYKLATSTHNVYSNMNVESEKVFEEETIKTAEEFANKVRQSYWYQYIEGDARGKDIQCYSSFFPFGGYKVCINVLAPTDEAEALNVKICLERNHGITSVCIQNKCS